MSQDDVLMQRPENRRIDSWKGIAAFFGRDARTVKRWEKERALPVYRVPGSERGGVFAYSDELTAWLHATPPAADAFEQAASLAAVTPDKWPSDEWPEPDTLTPAALPGLSDPLPGDTPAHTRVAGKTRLHRSRSFAGAAALLAVSLTFLAADALGPASRIGWHPWLVSRSVPSADRAETRAPRKPDADAEELYLKGRYLWNHRTGDSLTQAADTFAQAIRQDANYAEAYAGLAETYNLMPEYSAVPGSEAFPRAIAAATKAVALDDTLPAAHRALAFGLVYWQWEIPRALVEYRRAIALAPSDVESHHWYATSLLLLGRSQEAMAEMEKARKLNPASPSILADRSLVLDALGDHKNAIAELEAMERTEPGFLSPPRYLARIFLEQQRYPEFVAQLHRAATLSADPREKALADAAARGWRQGGSRGLLEAMEREQEQVFDHGQSSGFALAITCARLGRNRQAVLYLRSALAARDYDMFTVTRGWLASRLQDDQDFQQMQQQMLRRAGAPTPVAPRLVHTPQQNTLEAIQTQVAAWPWPPRS